MTTSARATTSLVLITAGFVGAVVGAGSAATSSPGREKVTSVAQAVAVSTGLQRRRPPRPGDVWGGCNDARAAGTAPIYRGEPGYRPQMDGDGDGIACEPYRR